MKKKWRWFAAFLLAALFFLPLLRVRAEQTLPDEKAERMEKARELDLQEWVDEDGYLTEAFLTGKSDRELSEMGLDGLIRTLSQEEIEAYVSRLQAGIELYTVTHYEKVSQINPDTGRLLYTGIFEVDGKLAFCIERSVATPPKGSPTGSPQLINNNTLRKVLYYGYNGPADQGYTYVETALAAGEANGDGDNSLGRKVLTEIKKYETPPSGFQVWKVETNGGSTQDLVYYTMEKKGSVKVKKVSADESMTSANNNYSLSGAVYGIYSDAACTKSVGRVTTKANGETEPLELSAGIYYVKELTPPQGYFLSNETTRIEVRAAETLEITVKNQPKVITPGLFVKKIDAETGKNQPQGAGSLAGARFVVKFYAGIYSEGVNPEANGVKASREWIFETDETGRILFQKEYKVSGDAVWTNGDGKIILPLGTVTIQEIQAPNGYRINPQVFVQKITSELDVLQTAVVPEEVIQLSLLKYYEQESNVIAGVSFLHVAPDGSEEILQTDNDGKIVIKGLQKGKHLMKEIAAPEQYMINGNPIMFTVDENNEIQIDSKVDESQGKVETSIDADGNLQIKVENINAFFRLILYKENENAKRLAGAEFTVYTDAACTKEAAKGVTDEAGELVIEGLKTHTTYYLKETIAPQGYELPYDLFGNPIVYEIYSNGSETQKEIQMTMLNQTSMRLPETGSIWMIPILMMGILCFMLAVKKERRKEHEM